MVGPLAGFGQARVDDSALGGCVLIVSGRKFRNNADDAPRGLHLKFLTALKPARRKASLGTTTGGLFLTATVMIVVPGDNTVNFFFLLHASRWMGFVKRDGLQGGSWRMT